MFSLQCYIFMILDSLVLVHSKTTIIQSSGIHYEVSGSSNENKFTFEISSVDAVTLLAFQINNNSIGIIEENVPFNQPSQRFVFPLNSKLRFNMRNVANEFSGESCFGEWKIVSVPPRTEAVCTELECQVDMFVVTNNPCTVLSNIWLLERVGNISINIKIKIEESLYFSVIVNVSVTENLIAFSTDSPSTGIRVRVSFSPKPNSNCPPVYKVHTVMKFNLDADENIESVNLHVDDHATMEMKSTSFAYTFSSVGSFRLRIKTQMLGNAEIWEKVVQVTNSSFNITVNGQLSLRSVESRVPVTFALFTENPCVVVPNDLTWSINETNFTGKNATYAFEKVGRQSKEYIVRIFEMPELVLNIQVYEAIKNFDVSLSKNNLCANENLTLTYKVDEGSDVLFTYRSNSVVPPIDGPSISQNVSFQRLGSHKLTLTAKNIISQQTKTAFISVHNDTVIINLKMERFTPVGDFEINLPPLSKCREDLYYHWSTSNDFHGGSRWLLYKPNTDIVVKVSFQREGNYSMTFYVLYNSNSSMLNKTIRTSVQQKIDYNLPPEINMTTSDVMILKSLNWVSSKRYRFRWLVNGNPSAWQIPSNGSLPEWIVANITEGHYNITLDARNNVSQVAKSTMFFVQHSARGVEIKPESVFVKAGGTAQIFLFFRRLSQFPYYITVKNTNEQFILQNNKTFVYNLLPMTKLKVVKFVFTVRDNIRSYDHSVRVEIIKPLEISKVELSKEEVEMGEEITASVHFTGTLLEINWSGNGVVSHRNSYAVISPTLSGVLQYMVTIRNQVSTANHYFNLTVSPSNKSLIVIFGQKSLKSPAVVNVENGTSVLFQVQGVQSTGFTYTWYFNDVLQEKVTDIEFRTTFKKQGSFKVKIVLKKKSAKINLETRISVEMELTGINLLDGHNKVYDTNNYLSSTESEIVLSHAVIYPTDALFNSGVVICKDFYQDRMVIFSKQFKGKANRSAIILTNSSKHDLIECVVIVHNNISRVSEFAFFHLMQPVGISFVTPDTILLNKTVLVVVQIEKNNVAANLTWIQDDRVVTRCSSGITISDKQNQSCVFTFLSDLLITIKVINQHESFNKSQFFTTFQAIPSVAIFTPNNAIQNTMVKLSVHLISNSILSYNWLTHDSNKSFVVVNASQDINASVNVSNVVDWKVFHHTLHAYPTLNGLLIISRNLLAAGHNYTFESSKDYWKLNYTWHVNGVAEESGQLLKHEFVDPGNYTVSLTVVSPFESTNSSKTVQVYNYNETLSIKTTGKFAKQDIVYVAVNKRVSFATEFIDPLTCYFFMIQPNESIAISSHTATSITARFLLTQQRYNMTMIGKSHLKTTIIKYRVFVQELIQNIRLSLATKFLLANRTYRFNVTWEGSETHLKYPLQVQGVKDFKIVRADFNLRTVDLTTMENGGNASLMVEICNNISCVKKAVYFQIEEQVSKVEPFPSQSFIALNSSLVLKVKKEVPDSVYKWYIGSNFIGFGQELLNISFSGYDPGNYTIRVNVSGPYIKNGWVEETFVITIFFDQCKSPTVDLGGGEMRQHIRSLWFYSEVNVSSDCTVAYQWIFYRADDPMDCVGVLTNLDIYRPEPMSGTTLKTNGPVLELPPRSFLTGTYCVGNRIKFGKNGLLDVSFFLNVKSTSLVPQIKGGSFRVIGNAQTLVLNASVSIDPDVGYPNKPNLLFQWVNLTRCLNEDATTQWSKSNSVVIIKPPCLVAYRDYFFRVKVQRTVEGEDIAEASQQIYVINGTAPLAEIRCITCDVYKTLKYTQHRELKLFVHCTNCGRLSANYQWFIVGDNDNVAVALNEDTILSPPGAAVLILKSGVLDGTQPYKISVNISVEGMDAVGTALFVLRPNPSPHSGVCALSPTRGYSLVTVFTLACSDWKDEDNTNQPFIYMLFVRTADGEFTIVSRGIRGTMHLLLPPGHSDDDTLQMEALVQDSLGAFTKVDLTAIVMKPLLGPDPGSFLEDSILPTFENDVFSKDTNRVTSTIISSIQLLGNATRSSSYETVINQFVAGVTSLSASSVESLLQIASSMDAILDKAGVYGVNDQLRARTSTSVENMLDLARSFSLEEIGLNVQTYLSLLRVITSNVEFDVESKTNCSLVKCDYDFLNRLYEVILATKIPGEKESKFESGTIATVLNRGRGASLQGRVLAGGCDASMKISDLDDADDLLQVFECSKLDPFTHGMHSSNVLSLSFRDTDYKEVNVNNLPTTENIVLNIPVTFNKTKSDSTLSLGPNTLYAVSVPTLFMETRLDEAIVSVSVDVLDSNDKGTVRLYFAEKIKIDKNEAVLEFSGLSPESQRTYTMSGSEFTSHAWQLGFEHSYPDVININVFVYASHCFYWNATTSVWESNGCTPTLQSTRDNIVCRCNHLTTFTSSFKIEPNPIDFASLKELDLGSNPVAFATCLTVVLLYLVALFFCYRKDRREQSVDHYIPFVGSDEGFYQYEIRFKTGPYPWAGTTSCVGIQIFGTSCTTKVRVIKSKRSFQRNGVDIFRISLDKSIGKIHKIHVWHDNTGDNPSWYLERTVIRNLVSGEKFFFFCNRWLGTDFDDGSIEHDFHVASINDIKKFSTIFYDVVGRGFSDFHLWLSVFERPKFSRFSRVQRVTCLVTMVLSWMCINAMWFRVAPDGQVDVYIGFQAYSLREVVVAMITVVMVFPLNLLFILLFKKSRQAKPPRKKLKIWQQPRRVHMTTVDIATEPLLSDESPHEFDFGHENLFTKRKTKKCTDIHEMARHGRDWYNPIGNFCASHYVDPIFIPCDIRKGSATISTRSGVSLMMSPLHNNRANSVRARRPTGEMQRTRSVNSLEMEILMSAQKERLMSPRLSEEQLGRHMENVVKQQISSMFNDLNEVTNDVTRDFSDHSSGLFYQDPRSLEVIARNELLAAQLQIPEILEYDACTRWTLPHWCVYVGYVCCFVVSSLSIVVTIAYGNQFGYEVSLKWLRALFVGLLEDFFLSYPIVLLLVSAFLALFVKPLDLDQVDHYDFVECESLGGLIPGGESASPPTGYALETAQRYGVKQKYIRKLAKVFMVQALLLWLVLGVCWSVPRATFAAARDLQREWNSPFHTRNIRSFDDYWVWTNQCWLPFVRRNSKDVWQVASVPRIWQQRSTVGSCPDPQHAFLTNRTQCMTGTDKKSYNAGWLSESFNSSLDSPWAFRKRKSGDLRSGYHVKSSTSDQHLQALKDGDWLDSNTKTLSHEVVLLNVANHVRVHALMTIEISLTGYMLTACDFKYYRQEMFVRSLDYFMIACVLLLLLVTVILTWSLVRKLHRHGPRKIWSFWNAHMVLMLLTSWVAILLQLSHVVYALGYQTSTRVFSYAVYNEVIISFFAFLAFLVGIRSVRLFKYTAAYEYCSGTLNSSFAELASFSLVHLIVAAGFAGWGLLVFQSHFAEYNTMWSSLFVTLFSRWWKPGYQRLTKTFYGMANAWFLLWTLYWLILALNFYKAVVISNSQQRRKAVGSSSKNLLKFMWQKVRRKNKKQRRVHFVVCDENENEVDATRFKSSTVLPPLPFKTFDLESNISMLLSGLEKMTNHDVWEEETFKRYERMRRNSYRQRMFID